MSTGSDVERRTALTTGGFGGFDAWLSSADDGFLEIDTALVSERIAVADIGFDEMIFANGGIDRRIRVFRLPDQLDTSSVTLSREMTLDRSHDNPLYVRVTQEDGHFIWSSPIYLVSR